MTRLLKRGLTLAVAESCTGGLISHKITQKAGASAYFKGAVVAYSNEAKQKILGVKKQTLASHGAVSPECALEMARGAKKLFNTDCAIATTGIAGPGGGSAKKPVGLVYIAISANKNEICKKFNFKGTRAKIKSLSAHAALNLLRVKNKPIML
ncbi:MAG: CinA family protein [Elusimicrobia bacterium]|nr:CinA family protein [Elusimicrobiota bacterium]